MKSKRQFKRQYEKGEYKRKDGEKLQEGDAQKMPEK